MTRIGISALVIALLGVASADAQAPRLRAQVESQRVYEGEPFLYLLTLSNGAASAEPEIPVSDDFKVELVGQTQLMSSSFTVIINGVTTQSRNDQGRRYEYRLTPLRSGRLTIPAATVLVDGTKIQSQAITVEVVGPSQQDIANLEIAVDHTTVYPLQPFTVTLKIYLKALPGRFARENPVHVAWDRVLHIPWVDPEVVSPALSSPDDLNEWLGPLQRRNGWGFNINNLGSPGLFSLFGNNATTFELAAQKVKRKDASGVEASYWEYILSRSFVAKSTGELVFGPVSLKGKFAVENARDPNSSQLNVEPVYTIAPAVKVNVKDVPLAGRPETFTGAVGDFTFHADLTPRQAKVGEPMTLTLTLRGDGLLETAGAPNLEAVPAVAESFKVYEATEETKAHERIFTYSIRPENKEAQEFPAIPISYFSTAEEKYVTVYTDPLPVEISAAERLSANDIVAGGPVRKETESVEVARDGLFANMSTPATLVDERVRPEWWFGGLSAMVVTYGLASVVAARVRTRNADPEAIRRRTAVHRARQRLAGGNRRAAEDPHAAIDAYRAACLGLLADALLVDEQGLTVGDIDRLAHRLDLDVELTRRLKQFVDHCDSARFAGMMAETTPMSKEAEMLVAAMAGELKAKRKLS